MSYIINLKGQVVARTLDDYKSGTEVRFAFDICDEAINASRDYNLVNAHSGKISNAKKHHKIWHELSIAVEINPGEFFIEGLSEGE